MKKNHIIETEDSMAYQKELIDNPICSRRFHISYDDDKPKGPVKVKCPFCTTTIFQSDSHSPVTLLRQENLITDVELSDKLVKECTFVDEFSLRTQKKPVAHET